MQLWKQTGKLVVQGGSDSFLSETEWLIENRRKPLRFDRSSESFVLQLSQARVFASGFDFRADHPTLPKG